MMAITDDEIKPTCWPVVRAQIEGCPYVIVADQRPERWSP